MNFTEDFMRGTRDGAVQDKPEQDQPRAYYDGFYLVKQEQEAAIRQTEERKG